jgi:hypothetical protein
MNTPLLAALDIAPDGYGTKPIKHGYDFARECAAVFGWR